MIGRISIMVKSSELLKFEIGPGFGLNFICLVASSTNTKTDIISSILFMKKPPYSFVAVYKEVFYLILFHFRFSKLIGDSGYLAIRLI